MWLLLVFSSSLVVCSGFNYYAASFIILINLLKEEQLLEKSYCLYLMYVFNIP